jgi:RNA polymerase sigma-70 factor (ECF subfamily)
MLLELGPPSHSLQDIMAAHSRYVTRLLRGLGVAEADLPDLRQDTFLVVHRQLPGFEGRSSLRTWIAGIVRRLASDYRAKARHTREQQTETLPEIAVAAGQQEWLEGCEGSRLVSSILSELREEQRAVFVMYEIENRSMLEIALTVDCPVSTAYARLQAARRAIREQRAAG